MATKRPTMKDFHVSVRVNVELSVRVLASTLDEALVKGRDVAVNFEALLDEAHYDDINDGSAEVVSIWTLD